MQPNRNYWSKLGAADIGNAPHCLFSALEKRFGTEIWGSSVDVEAS